MSMDDIHLWQNWAKWDIALVFKNLTEQWLSCLLGLGWFLSFLKGGEGLRFFVFQS